MKRTLFILLILVIGILGVVFFVSKGKDDDSTEYVTSVRKDWKNKEDFLKNEAGSPFKTFNLSFDSLKHFPINKKYLVKADLHPIEKKEVMLLGTSDGKEQRYLEFAYASFKIDNVPCSLLILEVMSNGPERGKLFLAFADNTSGSTTYGAGRYLDVKKVRGATSILLDFNLAYNPYCAYTDEYSCPLPPKENILAVAIEAGEKNYH